MTEHRVLVCGGRGYDEVDRAFAVLDGLSPRPTMVIQGGNKGSWLSGRRVPGADLIAHNWAVWRGINSITYAVDHRLDGPWPAAGPRRNSRMLAGAQPHLVVALPGGRGTADMVRRAKAAGVRVIEVR